MEFATIALLSSLDARLAEMTGAPKSVNPALWAMALMLLEQAVRTAKQSMKVALNAMPEIAKNVLLDSLPLVVYALIVKIIV